MPKLSIDELSLPLTVGQVAARAGISPAAVRFYEQQGLITSVRTEGNQRRYRRDVLRRVAIIKVAQRLGIPLAHVGHAFSRLPRDDKPTAAHWRAMSAAWRADLDTRIHALVRLRDALDGCIGCGCLSISDCPLRNPHDAMSERGPGARVLEEALEGPPGKQGRGRKGTGDSGRARD